ncbi:unnamed protein product, partial [Mesorhabditis belari]|uniref:Riboflavin transporter n=1 Tax=Mesorhabditis belari TaxID=2138241 RepID=A0AAF3EBH2_9BILA
MSSIILHIAVLIFSMSSWLSVNAIFTQLPILANVAPESWNIASYLVLIIQISCVIPLLYGIVKHRFPQLIKTYENYLILFLLLVTVLGLFLTTLTFKERWELFQAKHAVPLLLVLLLVSIPCTTSDVLFLPYMSHFHDPHLLTTFFVGMGLGALIPSALSFVQGSPTVTSITDNSTGRITFNIDARLSFEHFMYIMAACCVLSILAFFYLIHWVRYNSGDHTPAKFAPVETVDTEKKPIILGTKMLVLLALSFCVGALQNSLLPVLLQYAAQAYGQETYHLANTLFVMTNPVFCLAQLFITIQRIHFFLALFSASMVPTIFIAVLACLSERLAWAGAEAMLCISAGLGAGLLSWSKTALAQSLRATEHPRALFWCGAAIQTGSCVGALVMFCLANLLHVFPAS